MNKAGEIYSKLIKDDHNRLVLAVDFDKMQKIIDNLQQRIDKAIEKYKNCKEEDYCTLALDMYDILRGEDNESN
jgi:hypothetical protein